MPRAVRRIDDKAARRQLPCLATHPALQTQNQVSLPAAAVQVPPSGCASSFFPGVGLATSRSAAYQPAGPSACSSHSPARLVISRALRLRMLQPIWYDLPEDLVGDDGVAKPALTTFNQCVQHACTPAHRGLAGLLPSRPCASAPCARMRLLGLT